MRTAALLPGQHASLNGKHHPKNNLYVWCRKCVEHHGDDDDDDDGDGDGDDDDDDDGDDDDDDHDDDDDDDDDDDCYFDIENWPWIIETSGGTKFWRDRCKSPRSLSLDLKL